MDRSKKEIVPVTESAPAMVPLSVRILPAQCSLRVLIFVGLLTRSLTCASDDAWPRYAHDAALTGRTPLKGDIRTPRESWSMSLTGIQLDVELSATDGEHVVPLHNGLNQLTGPRKSTFTSPRRMDITGTGRLVPVTETPASRWGRILPHVKGIQNVRWNHSETTERICQLELIAWDMGVDEPRTVWQSKPEDTIFAPLMVIEDIDHDGVDEICIATHYRVMVYEGTTGRKETDLRYHTGRNYGWFGLVDVDLDGQQELVMLADFQSHFEVLDYDSLKPEEDRLSVRWKRDIELQIDRRATWPQIGPRPVVNVAGDARPEIVVNLYNEDHDGQWHTQIIDAATGRILLDLPNRYVQGSADVDGDLTSDLFCMVSRGCFVPEFGQVEIIDVDGGDSHVLWSRMNSGFAAANQTEMEPTWATGASDGLRHVLLTCQDSRQTFVVVSRDPTSSISAIRTDTNDQFRTLWHVTGFATPPNPIALTTSGDSVTALVGVNLDKNQQVLLAGNNANATVVTRRPLGAGPLAPIAARPQPAGLMNIYVEGPGENIFSIAPPTSENMAPRILWQRPGRGMGNNFSNGAILAADLDNDHSVEIVCAGRDSSGAAELVAYRSDGEVYWRHVYSETQGSRPKHNAGALTWWWAGRFRSSEQVDLFVNTRRGLMNSEVGHLLDGRTGGQIWKKEKALLPNVFQWGYGGFPLAVADMTGNRRDELVNLYPVCYWMADGKTGQLIAGQDLASQEVVPAWAAYGEPTVWDFDGDGNKEVLLDSVYILALLDSSGTTIWHDRERHSDTIDRNTDASGETTKTRHALVDFDGDGRMEIASAGYRDGVRAIDPRNGSVLWSVDAPNPTRSKSAAANIDGIGGDELIYTAGKSLVVVSGDRNAGRILWTWDGPAELSLPAIADVDNDGKAEIVFQSARGIIHCIDGPVGKN
ncbi:MAG: hypothetical protein MK102_09290 [Fuerstiella sp.]|nr:hypothetical protein [Fuerstiella sp.]